MTLQDELYQQYLREKQLREYNEQKKQRQANYLDRAKGLYDNLNSGGSKLNSFGKFLGQSQNKNVASFGNKMQSLGNKLQSFNQPSLQSILGTTGVGSSGGSIANSISNIIPSASSSVPSTLSAGLGTGAGTGIGAGLGTGAGSAGLGSSLAGSSMGSSALGSSLLGATGGSSAGMGAAGATSALSGSTAAATGAGAGAAGAAAGASMAVPVVGWVVAAALMAKAIKDKFDEAHKKVNAKAMQADAENMNKTIKANNESIEESKNTFQNASEQAAQQMTQPTNLYQDIINQINPQSMITAPTSSVNTQTDINTPVDNQTALNELPMSTQEEGMPTGGAVPVNASLGTKIRGLFNKNIKPSQIMDNGSGGAILDKEATKTLASQYQEPKESLLEKIRNGLSQFKAGYDDNSLNGFADGDLANKLAGNTQQPVTPQDGVLTGSAAETKKTLMNRIGEAAGTGRRLMANPWVQAGIAAGISKADGGDIGDMAKAAYQYGTAKAKSDQYYRMMNPDATVMPVLNTYGAEDYKAKAYNDFNLGRSVITRRQLLKLQNPDKSDIEIDAMAKAQGIDPDEPISIKGYETVVKGKQKDRDLDIKADKNQWQKNQGQQKIGIQAKNANTNAGRLAETKRSNSVKETQKNRDLDIKEKNANNKGSNTTKNTDTNEGKIVVNPKTGQRLQWHDGRWVEIK